jgi:hypothetical protein
MVLQKESRLRTPVQNVSVGKFDATADNLVGNVSGVGLQNHVIMTNIAKELFHLESMGFKTMVGSAANEKLELSMPSPNL